MNTECAPTSRQTDWVAGVLVYNARLRMRYRVSPELGKAVQTLREKVQLDSETVARYLAAPVALVLACEGRGARPITRADFECVAILLAGFAAGRNDGGASIEDSVEEVARLSGLRLELRSVCPLPSGW